MSKIPVKQNFPEFNRFSFCCSLQTWVNNQEVNSSYHWKNFPYIYQHGLYLNPLVSVAISATDFHKRLRVSINKFCRVIDRQIASTSNLHKIEHEEKKQVRTLLSIPHGFEAVHHKMYDETRWQNVRQACDRARSDGI